MSSKFYSSFLQATCDVFELMLDISDISEHPADCFECDEELDISIEIIGDLAGEVVYRFPKETSLKIVTIMSGMQMELVDDFVISAISEISNIISGNVLTMLAGENLTCDIRPPRLKKTDAGKDYVWHKDSCISTPAGDVCLEIRLNPNKEL